MSEAASVRNDAVADPSITLAEVPRSCTFADRAILAYAKQRLIILFLLAQATKSTDGCSSPFHFPPPFHDSLLFHCSAPFHYSSPFHHELSPSI